MEESSSLINGETSFNGLGFSVPPNVASNLPFANGQELLQQQPAKRSFPMTPYGYPGDINAARNLAQHPGLVGVDGMGSGSLAQFSGGDGWHPGTGIATSAAVTNSSTPSGNMMMAPNFMPPTSAGMSMMGRVMPPPPYSFPGGMWMQPRPPWMPGHGQHGASVSNSVYGANAMGDNVSNSSMGNSLAGGASNQLQGPYKAMPPAAAGNVSGPPGNVEPMSSKSNVPSENSKRGDEKGTGSSSYAVMSLISSTASDMPSDHPANVQAGPFGGWVDPHQMAIQQMPMAGPGGMMMPGMSHVHRPPNMFHPRSSFATAMPPPAGGVPFPHAGGYPAHMHMDMSQQVPSSSGGFPSPLCSSRDIATDSPLAVKDMTQNRPDCPPAGMALTSPAVQGAASSANLPASRTAVSKNDKSNVKPAKMGPQGPEDLREMLDPVYKISDDPRRREFLDRLLKFCEEQGGPALYIPTMASDNLAIDIYMLFKAVNDFGGLKEVVRKKVWRKVIENMGLDPPNNISSLASVLRCHYTRLLLPLECHEHGANVAEEMEKIDTLRRRRGAALPPPSHPPVSSVTSPNSRQSGSPDSTKALSHHPSRAGTPGAGDLTANSTGDSGDVKVKRETRNSKKSAELCDSTVSLNSSQSITSANAQPMPDASQDSKAQSKVSSSDGTSVQATMSWPQPAPGQTSSGSQSQSSAASGKSARKSDTAAGQTSSEQTQDSGLSSTLFLGSAEALPASLLDEIINDLGEGSAPGAAEGGMTPCPAQPQSDGNENVHGAPASNTLTSLLQQSSHPVGFDQQHMPMYMSPHSSFLSQVPQQFPLPPQAVPPYSHPTGQPHMPMHPPSSMAGSGNVWPTSMAYSSNTAMTPPIPQAVQRLRRLPGRPSSPDSSGGLQRRASSTKLRPSRERTPDSRTGLNAQGPVRPPSAEQQTSGAEDSTTPVFPPDCIEQATPHSLKRRRLTARELGQVPNLWRLHMSLKCGLLAESTRALELLSILTSDDHTLGLFMLPQQPTILETVLCHFIACLRDTFGKDVVSSAGATSKCQPDGIEEECSELNHVESVQEENSCSHSEQQPYSTQAKSMIFDTEHVFTHFEGDGIVLERLSASCQCHLASALQSAAEEEEGRGREAEGINTPGQDAFSAEDSETCSSDDNRRHGPPAGAALHRRSANFPRSWLRHSAVCEPDPCPLVHHSHSQQALARRCQALSNILRSFSFLPQNERHMARHEALMEVVSSVLLLHQQDRENSSSGSVQSSGSCAELTTAWWWSCLEVVRADLMVLLVNVSGQMELSSLPESNACALIQALVHWCVSSCSSARDSLPSAASAPGLALQRLALEALGKISIGLGNAENMLALLTPSEWQTLCGRLVQWLMQKRHNVQHELALVLLSGLACVHAQLCVHLCQEHSCLIPLMLQQLTDSEANLRALASGMAASDSYTGTSLDILRRAALLLLALAKEQSNHIRFQLYQEQLLFLAASSSLDMSVTGLIADILYQLTLD